jgi:UDP-N-acetylmuramate--alanine ligase
MEIHPLPGGARLIVDYAHHPAKVAALVASVGLSATGRVIAVFQPHRYTRTKHLGRDFGPAFAGWSPAHLPGTGTGPVDELIVLPIYAASEDSIPGVDSGLVARSARRAGVPKVRRAESFEQARAILARRMAPGDTVLLVGAGDVNALAEGLTDS